MHAYVKFNIRQHIWGMTTKQGKERDFKRSVVFIWWYIQVTTGENWLPVNYIFKGKERRRVGGGGRRVEGHIVILYPPGSGRGLASDSSTNSKTWKREEPFKVFFFSPGRIFCKSIAKGLRRRKIYCNCIYLLKQHRPVLESSHCSA